MMKPIFSSTVLSLMFAAICFAQVVSYDAAFGVFPEAQGWDYDPFCTPERWFEEGFLYQEVQIGECGPPPGGDRDLYRLPLDDFIGAETLFVEWRMATDATEPWGGSPGAVLAVGNQGGEIWWFGFSRDEVQFFQDANIVVNEFFAIEPGLRTYRLEIHGTDTYTIHIDGELVLEATPGDVFPSFNPSILWRARAWTMDNVTHWAYVRYGVISEVAGDFNSDAQIDSADLYFFEECLTTEAGSWPGCAWADFDADGSVTCADAAAFQEAWTGPGDPPAFTECFSVLCSADLNFDGVVDAVDLASLLGSWGANPGHPADLNEDGVVNAADLAELLGSWGACE